MTAFVRQFLLHKRIGPTVSDEQTSKKHALFHILGIMIVAPVKNERRRNIPVSEIWYLIVLLNCNSYLLFS